MNSHSNRPLSFFCFGALLFLASCVSIEKSAPDEWRKMAKLSKLMTPADFMGMGRQSLKEKFVDDALEFYKRGVNRFPSHADLRKDLASLYSSLEKVTSNQSRKKEYRSGALFHWNKLKGTKHDALAQNRIRQMSAAQ